MRGPRRGPKALLGQRCAKGLHARSLHMAAARCSHSTACSSTTLAGQREEPLGSSQLTSVASDGSESESAANEAACACKQRCKPWQVCVWPHMHRLALQYTALQYTAQQRGSKVLLGPMKV